MDNPDNKPTSEEFKKSAYLTAIRLRKSGLDYETVYARLEKQGISDELARQVINDLVFEDEKTKKSADSPFYNIAIIKIGIGVFAAILCVFFVPGVTILPVGLIATGIISALMFKNSK